MFIEKELSYKRHWINIDSDIISEQSYLYTKYDIDQETIEYALDKNERAHMDYNRENGTITFIYNVLALEKDNEYYETIPLTFIVQDTRLVTISNKDNAYVISKMQDFVRFFCKIPLHNAKKCCIIRSGTDGSKEFEQSGLPPWRLHTYAPK